MLWVSKFGIVDGEAVEDSPWVGAFPDSDHDEESSDLYMIVHPALPGSEEFCADLRDAIGQTYHRKKVSLTGGLLRVLQAAHEDLREWNSRSLREHQIGAGVSALALQGREAYLAQVGPASTVFYRDFEATEVTPTIPDADVTLGAGDDFWPQFTRYELADGDRIVLMTPGPAEAMGTGLLAEMLQLPAEEAVKELFRHLRGEAPASAGAVLIAAEADPVEETALQTQAPKAQTA
jgi:hypothetical protein